MKTVQEEGSITKKQNTVVPSEEIIIIKKKMNDTVKTVISGDKWKITE